LRFGIARLVLGSSDFAEISEEDYARYCKAKLGVIAVLQIEEKMDIVLKNHMELEESLLEIALKDTMFGAFNWHRGREQVQEINRRVINLLSSVRLYRDQVCHDLSQIYGKDSPERDSFVRLTNDAYDSVLGYRAIEALRNYVQHRGLPIDTYNPITHRQENSEGLRIARRSIAPKLDFDELSKHKFKKSVLQELKSAKNDDLKTLLRSYIDALGSIHIGLRKIVAEDVGQWETALEEVPTRFLDVTEANATIGLAVVKADDKRLIYHDSEQIFGSMAERLRWLERKNAFYVSLESTFVTGEPTVSVRNAG